jgi:hypothetical protein
MYSVDSLPTVASAASATINIVPGFPTDSAKATGGDFTPFARPELIDRGDYFEPCRLRDIGVRWPVS